MRFAAAGGEGDGATATHALWWPPGKVAGRYLAPWLAVRDEEALAGDVPHSGSVPVQVDLHRDDVALC